MNSIKKVLQESNQKSGFKSDFKSGFKSSFKSGNKSAMRSGTKSCKRRQRHSYMKMSTVSASNKQSRNCRGRSVSTKRVTEFKPFSFSRPQKENKESIFGTGVYKPFSFARSLRGGAGQRSKSNKIKKSRKLKNKKVKKLNFKKKKLVPKTMNKMNELKEILKDIIPTVSDKSSDKRKLKEVDQSDVFKGKEDQIAQKIKPNKKSNLKKKIVRKVTSNKKKSSKMGGLFPEDLKDTDVINKGLSSFRKDKRQGGGQGQGTPKRYSKRLRSKNSLKKSIPQSKTLSVRFGENISPPRSSINNVEDKLRREKIHNRKQTPYNQNNKKSRIPDSVKMELEKVKTIKAKVNKDLISNFNKEK